MDNLKTNNMKRIFLFFAVFFLLIGLLSAGLGALDKVQNDKIRKDFQNVLLKYNEAVPFSEAAVAELNQIFAQKVFNPVRLARVTYVSIAKHPDYPSIQREGDEEIVYEFTDAKPRFWEVIYFGGLNSAEQWDSIYEDTDLENMWRLVFSSSYTSKQYGMIVFGGTAICLLASGWFWYCWAKKRKQS